MLRSASRDRLSADLLRPEVVAKLGSIGLKARLVVEGFLAGLHRSPFKGFSVEFAEHRPYMPGDELKRIDWRVYARTDRFVVREYEEETNLRAYLLVDASGSMGFGSGPTSKIEYARVLAASLAYLLLHQRDSAGLVSFTDRIDSYIPPRSAPAHLNVLLRSLSRMSPGGDTDLAGTFHQLAERIRRRGLVIIISDLWDRQQEVIKALRHFRHRKHEVIVFHLLDPGERKLLYRQPLILRDLETGDQLTLDPRVVGRRYQEEFSRYCQEFERGCREAYVDYHLLTTDTPFDRALMSYLEHRQRLW